MNAAQLTVIVVVIIGCGYLMWYVGNKYKK
jgi:hypothetical protein